MDLAPAGTRAFWLTATTALIGAAGLAYWAAAAALYGFETLGIASGVFSAAALAATLVAAGLALGATREAALGAAPASSLTLSLALSAPATAIAHLAATWTGHPLLAAALTPAIMLTAAATGHLVATGDTRQIFHASAIGLAVRFATLPLGATGVVLGYAASIYATLAALLAAVARHGLGKPSTADMARIAKAAYASYPRALSLAALPMLISVVSGFAKGAETAGAAYLAASAVVVLGSAAIAVSRVAIPDVATGQAEWLSEGARLGLTISVAAGAATLTATPLLATLGMQQIAEPLALSVAALPLLAGAEITMSKWLGEGRLRLVAAAGAARLAAAATAAYLDPRLALPAAAIASAPLAAKYWRHTAAALAATATWTINPLAALPTTLTALTALRALKPSDIATLAKIAKQAVAGQT